MHLGMGLRQHPHPVLRSQGTWEFGHVYPKVQVNASVAVSQPSACVLRRCGILHGWDRASRIVPLSPLAGGGWSRDETWPETQADLLR